MKNETITPTKATAAIEAINELLAEAAEQKAEIEAYKAAHPEETKQVNKLPKAVIAMQLLQLLEDLGRIEKTSPETKLAELRYLELNELLGFQCLSKELDEFYHSYISRKKSANYDDTLLIIDIFNYGRICGIRAERAKKRDRCHE